MSLSMELVDEVFQVSCENGHQQEFSRQEMVRFFGPKRVRRVEQGRQPAPTLPPYECYYCNNRQRP